MSEPTPLATAVSTERLISATPADIFNAFEKPKLLAQWWGPKGFSNTFDLFEFTPGGRWNFTMHGPNNANYPNQCVFREITPHTKIIIDHVSHPHFYRTTQLQLSC